MLAPPGRSRACVLAVTLGLGVVVTGWPGSGAAELFAARLTAENLEARRPRGPDAVAGLGDFVLGNGVVCAAISAPDHESTLSQQGGVLIDLGHCGRGDDQWGVLHPMINLSRESTLPVRDVSARVTPESAEIVTRGRLDGLEVTTTYAVDARETDRLRIVSRVERREDGDAVFLLGDVVLHGHRQLTPFTLATGRPAHTVGFRHPSVEIDSPWSMIDAILRADMQVLVGGSHLEPQIAYGWRIVEARLERADGTRDPLAHLAMNGEHFSLLGVYADTLLFGGEGRPTMLELAQTLLMDLHPGDALVYVREIVLGTRADVASVTDRLWADGPEVTGRVDDPDARLHVLDEHGVPVTFVRPEPDGRFSFRLPPGTSRDFEVRARLFDEVRATREIRFDEGRGPFALGVLRTGSSAELALPRGIPMRLIFEGIHPTPDPTFGGDGLDFHVGDERIASSTESNGIALAGVSSDPTSVRLRPGRYRVLATRGPEWSVSEAEVVLPPGGRVALSIVPPVRQVEQPGWVSADFHVHAAPSDDSSLPLRMRIAAFAASGADVIVATEHDHVFDYRPTIEAMGLGDAIASLVGVELTSTVVGDATPFTSGHANAFPLVPDAQAFRGGAPRGENRRLRDVVGSLRERPGRPILQLNHPRESGADQGLSSYLSHLAVAGSPFDPTRPLTAAANRDLSEPAAGSGLRDLDFDAIELLNGSSMTAYRMTRADWLSFILQGERRTGTANSDSHSAASPIALPRSYVAYSGPLGGDFAAEPFVAAVRAGRVVGSTGPVLDVRLGEAGPGERHAGSEGELVVVVRRADWVPVEELRIYVNGVLAERRPLSADGVAKVPLRFAKDAFVTVEVEGSAEPGSVYARVAPGFTPFAFTNPIWVDADGDGTWTPPGLPDPAPKALASPLDAR